MPLIIVDIVNPRESTQALVQKLISAGSSREGP